MDTDDKLMTPGEVAAVFRVDPKTVTRWVNAGRFETGDTIRTLGGHVRIRQSAVNRLLVGRAAQVEG